MTIETDAGPHQDVIIVGAGPVGLLLAGELAGGGVHVAVIDRAVEPSAIPKANGVVGHSALALARRGILAGTGLRVLSPPRFPFGPLSLDLGIGRRNPLHILPIPQRRLEELLESRAVRRGVRMLRGHEVVGFAQDDVGVVADVCGPGGTIAVPARYLVGCDGARSLVRKHAGIGFPGITSDRIARIGRVTIPAGRIVRTADGFDIPGVGRVAAMRANPLPGGGFSIAPAAALDPAAPDDLYVISTHEPRGDVEPSDDVPVDELRASLRRVLGADLPFTDAVAIRSTVANSRHADAYRHGRVLLAGDAAHIFNAGGSSLNIGLQDAIELAGRLDAVIRDGASADGPGAGGLGADPLDAYEAARRPAAERALQHTRTQAMLAREDDEGRALREVFSPLVADRTAARSLGRLIESA